ncbi:MAG: ClpXP protease specificity-enhancing factor [Candidatus Schmidhempelia sp.]|nr:ClpXP protease specificity-enhancing factor [Candidatus Schmidhempelia sp.]
MDMSTETLLPKRPYLFRAFYDWIIDNQLTPQIVVNTTVQGVNVPSEYVKDGQIILNIAPHAIGQFIMNNDAIEFNARFNGIMQAIYIPMAAIEALYARENNEGLGFAPEIYYEQQNAKPIVEQAQTTQSKSKPTFKVVK